MTSIKLSSASIDKLALTHENVYGVAPTGRTAGETKLVDWLGDLVPGPWVADMTGVLIPTHNQRFEEFVMPATVSTSTSPNVIGGAAVSISHANGPVGTLHSSVEAVTGTSFGGTFNNATDTSAKNIRVSLPGATMPMVTELSNSFDGMVDSCSNRAPLFARLFSLLEAVAHGWALVAIPGGANNALSGENIFWVPGNAAAHQNWVNRVLAVRGSQVSPLSMVRHKNGIQVTPAIANALWLACQPFCGVGQLFRAGGVPGVAGRHPDAITLAIYGTSGMPAAGNNVPGVADVTAAMKYLLRISGDSVGYAKGFDIFAKRIEFAGPELSILPTPLNERFYQAETVSFCRIWALIFRALFLRCSRDADSVDWGLDVDAFDAGDVGLQGVVDELLGLFRATAPAVARATINTNEVWRRVAAAPWLAVADNFETWVWGYGGHRDPLEFEKSSRTDTWIALGAAVGVAADYSFSNLFGLPPGQDIVILGRNIPNRNLLDNQCSVPADGVYGRHLYPICSGVAEFMGNAEAKTFKTTGTEGISRIISAINAGELLSRMYFPAVALRCACNQASHLQGNSRMANSMAMGTVDTGDPAFDDVYSEYVAKGAIVDQAELVDTHCDLVRGILAWKDSTASDAMRDYSNSITTSAVRNKFIKEVAFHPMIDSLVLGVSSAVGGVINAQSASLTILLQSCRAGLATIALADSVTRPDAVGLSAWLMQAAGMSVMWGRRLQYFDEDHQLVSTSTFEVVRNSVRLTDGFYGLPRIDSVYHWYYCDGMDGVWTADAAEACSPPIARQIMTVGGAYRSLYVGHTNNVTRTDFGGGPLSLQPAGVVQAYRGLYIGGGGASAYRTSTPNFSPPVYVPVDAAGRIDDLAAVTTLPGKFMNLKTTNRSLISGLNVPARPTSGFDIMSQVWRGVGSLAAKLGLFGLTGNIAKNVNADSSGDSTNGGQSNAGTVSTVGTNNSSNASSSGVSAVTMDSGLKIESKGEPDAKLE